MRNVISLMIIFVLSGCAGIFNPYDSDFTCPATYQGKCVSIKEAYNMSLNPDFKEPVQKDYKYEYNEKDKKESQKSEKNHEKGYILSLDEEQGSEPVKFNKYTEALYNKMRGLLEEPQTPVVMPPKIMRILILAYPEGRDMNSLYMPRYVYTIVDTPKWVIVDPYMLNKPDGGE